MSCKGLIKPEYGQWRWPFKVMEEGESFLVDPLDRSIQRVRQLAYAYAYRLGMKFSVGIDAETGLIRVQRVDGMEYLTEDLPPMSWAVFVPRMHDLYGIDAGFVHWEMVDEGEEFFIPAKRRQPAQEHWRLVHIGRIDIEVKLEADGIRYRRAAVSPVILED